jgi:hypothetical protein
MKPIRTLLIICFAVFAMNLQAAEVIFCGNTDGQYDLYRANIAAGEIQRLTRTSSNELMPAISPDGKHLCFISDREGADSVYLVPMQAAGDASAAVNISAGIGAYAHPAFSPDSLKIAVQYAPDPEDKYKNTRIVILDPASHTQEILVDSSKLKTSENNGSVTVVDRPQWVSESLIVYILAEYADPTQGRMTKSTIYMFDLKKQQHLRIAGGEGYYDGEGHSMGFKATMPYVVTEKDRSRSILFTAVRGVLDREPLKFAISGGGKGAIAINDEQYFGPLFYSDGYWIYGVIDDNGTAGLAWKTGNLNAARQTLDFAGAIIYPAVVR